MKKLMLHTFLFALISTSAQSQELIKRLDAYDDPDTLTQMASIAAKHGAADKMMEFLELASRAKQRAQVSFPQSLMRGDVEGAMIAAKRGGFTALAKQPEKVDPSNPSDHRWKIQYERSPEIVLDAKQSFEMMSAYYAQQNAYERSSVGQPKKEDTERQARTDLMEEQKRALQDHANRASTAELRDHLIINELLGTRH